jgi:hypothetical protein
MVAPIGAISGMSGSWGGGPLALAPISDRYRRLCEDSNYVKFGIVGNMKSAWLPVCGPAESAEASHSILVVGDALGIQGIQDKPDNATAPRTERLASQEFVQVDAPAVAYARSDDDQRPVP